jgi:hypothetical protein
MEETRTIEGWDGEFGYVILDPDGFDRKDPQLYERLFTAEEYKEGSMRSTIEITDLDLFNREN